MHRQRDLFRAIVVSGAAVVGSASGCGPGATPLDAAGVDAAAVDAAVADAASVGDAAGSSDGGTDSAVVVADSGAEADDAFVAIL